MMRQAARDPLWAFVALLAAPFRIWKPLLGLLFLLVIVLFVVGFGGRFALEQIGFRVGSVPVLLLDLVTLLVLLALAFPLPHQSADYPFRGYGRRNPRLGPLRHRQAKRAPSPKMRDGLLIGRDRKSGKLLRYAGPAHLLTIAPTRTGKGVGTIIPNLLDYPGSGRLHRPQGRERPHHRPRIAPNSARSMSSTRSASPAWPSGAAFNPLDRSTLPASISPTMPDDAGRRAGL
jgi:type IV secretion system protein VirD4